METEVNKTKINGRPRWQERTKEQIMNSPSTSSRKMAGLFPPSSSVVLFRLLSPAAFMISCPTCQQSLSWSAVLPIKNSPCHDQLSHLTNHCHDRLLIFHLTTVPVMITCPTWQQSLSKSAVPPDKSLSWSTVPHVNTVNNQLSHLSTQSLSWSAVPPVNTVTVMFSCPTCQHCHCHVQLSHLSTVNNQLSHLSTQSLTWSAVSPVNTQAWSAVPPVDLKYCYFSYTCIIFSCIVLSSIYLSIYLLLFSLTHQEFKTVQHTWGMLAPITPAHNLALTSVDPVKATLLISGWLDSAAPAVGP